MKPQVKSTLAGTQAVGLEAAGYTVSTVRRQRAKHLAAQLPHPGLHNRPLPKKKKKKMVPPRVGRSSYLS